MDPLVGGNTFAPGYRVGISDDIHRLKMEWSCVEGSLVSCSWHLFMSLNIWW
jgi:hypothetical protein